MKIVRVGIMTDRNELKAALKPFIPKTISVPYRRNDFRAIPSVMTKVTDETGKEELRLF